MPDSIFIYDKLPMQTLLDSVQVIETPSTRFDGDTYMIETWLRSDISFLLLLAFLLVAISLRHGYRYFLTLIEAPVSIKKRDNIFEHRTMNETFVLFALLFNTVVEGGIIMLFMMSEREGISLNAQAINVLGVCLGCTAAYMLMQYLLYKVVGYTFSDEASTKTLIHGYNSTWSILGLMLLPVTILASMHGMDSNGLIISALCLFLISKSVFIIKTFRIFFIKNRGILLFILYLCTLEIVPFVIYISGTIYFCKSV